VGTLDADGHVSQKILTQ